VLFARIYPDLLRPLALPLTAGAALFAVSGCTADKPPPAAREVTTVPVAPVAPIAPAALDRFVAAVRQQLPSVVIDHRDEEVAEIGEQACDSLAAGKANAAVLGEIGEFGVTAADARKLLTLARSNACRS
jgi:hypothetical protein